MSSRLTLHELSAAVRAYWPAAVVARREPGFRYGSLDRSYDIVYVVVLLNGAHESHRAEFYKWQVKHLPLHEVVALVRKQFALPHRLRPHPAPAHLRRIAPPPLLRPRGMTAAEFEAAEAAWAQRR